MPYTCYQTDCQTEVPEKDTFCETHKREYWHEDKKDVKYWQARFSNRATGMIQTPIQPPLVSENPYAHLTFEELKELDHKAVAWLRDHKYDASYPKAFTKYQLLIKTLNARTPGM